jgi:protein phosphatase
MKLRTFALSDIGRVRVENEDSWLCDDQHRVYAVADGIGGLPEGAQASQMAIAALREYMERIADPATVDYRDCLNEVNDRVFLLGQIVSTRHGIGTTLTGFHAVNGHLHVVHVGDSALLRVRGGEISYLTTDHTVENEMRSRAPMGSLPPTILAEHRNALTRCVGQPPPVLGEFTTFDLQPGDRYLLCTDGVSRVIKHAEIARIATEAPDPETCVRQLIDRANETGGFDNATVVALFADA